VYDHTHIASYWHWGARSVGKRVRLLALDSRNAELAGGLSSNPFLSGPCRTIILYVIDKGGLYSCVYTVLINIKQGIAPTLIKEKIKFFSYIRKFRWVQLQSHI
jgi:hypothetical protein